MDLKEVFTKLPPAKKLLVEPYVLPDERFVEKWEQEREGQANMFPIENGFTTERGELVRSKSEKMIADKLLFRNIPYKYEMKLKLADKHVVYPDFTMLNVRTREEYYLEHFGMMDDPEYCKRAIEKIELMIQRYLR